MYKSKYLRKSKRKEPTFEPSQKTMVKIPGRIPATMSQLSRPSFLVKGCDPSGGYTTASLGFSTAALSTGMSLRGRE